MQGPAQERCDVVYFPIGQASGLHLVHPTWAGTFVLAALCLVFPGLHIVLDSDCVPVFFLLHAAQLRSSCEEGPGQSALQSAYHNPHLDETELKQNRSDCIPVTLLEVEDLWQEAQRLQHSGFPGPVPTSSCAGGLNLDRTD